MKTYFAYTRVSTQRQGEQGVSLQEQKAEIERYATQKGLAISTWFEERETAAKIGRRIFTDMLKRLRKGEAQGVIIHKIDRSARNLRDWVDVAQLAEDGIEVHFTRESLDLKSSSGRLAADVQAVVASNYIRNLREETIKGFYGRLKQGVYPMPAPIGYLNAGAGKPKIVDPVRGPLIREAFRLYSTGQYSLRSLAAELHRRGLRPRRGTRISATTLGDALANPFYYGLMVIKKTNQSFMGNHEPLISHELFEQVKVTMSGKVNRAASPTRREFLFGRLVRCENCGRSLVGEMQRGHIYYRCHSSQCPSTVFREELLDQEVKRTITGLQIHPEEIDVLDRYAAHKERQAVADKDRRAASIEVKIAAVKDRLNRLTDIYIDGNIDQDAFNERKKALLSERLEYEDEMRQLNADPTSCLRRMREYVELVKRLYLQYEVGNLQEKRQVLESTMSNRSANGKSLEFKLKSALSEAAQRPNVRFGGPPRLKARTSGKRNCANHEETSYFNKKQQDGAFTGTPSAVNKEFWKQWVDQMCGKQDEGLGKTPK
jgi:DNA invertase Pin-like site-specific DNA recombinase